MNEFGIKITRDSNEIRAAQRLRFEAFNLEMKKGEAFDRQGLDADDYDPICDHLIVRDLNNNRVVGTYRLLLGSEARSHFGFFSEREFNLENIKKLRGELLELGRSCVHRDYRDGVVIDIMWQAIADYVRSHGVRYLFGCPRLYTTHLREVSEFFVLLKKKYYAPEEIRVLPVPGKFFPDLDEKIEIQNRRRLFRALPSLIKGYLRVGAVVCGPPALDLDVGTAYLFLLLDVSKMSRDYRRRLGFSSPGACDAMA